MKKSHVLSLIMGVIILEITAQICGVDKVANQIQLISAAPWAFMVWRIEELHRKHRK